MKKTIDERDFIQEFKDCGREDSFSRAALKLIFSFIEREEYDTGEEIELDVIGICGDYNEVPILQFVKDYDIDIEDFIDVDDYEEEEDEFNYDNYLKLISEVLINDCPEDYINYQILSDELVRKDDDEDKYYRILSIAIYENDSWIVSSEVYFVTDIDYKFSNIAETTAEAVDLGNKLDCDEYNLQLDEEEKKKPSWEDIDEDKLEEIISEYISERSCLVGFTNQGTVVFQDF